MNYRVIIEGEVEADSEEEAEEVFMDTITHNDSIMIVDTFPL